VRYAGAVRYPDGGGLTAESVPGERVSGEGLGICFLRPMSAKVEAWRTRPDVALSAAVARLRATPAWALTGHGPGSRAGAHVLPEGVDAGVPPVRHLLKGLVALGLLHFESRLGDRLGDRAAELEAGGRVHPAGQHQGRRGDPR
jgi:hypothetical protein